MVQTENATLALRHGSLGWTEIIFSVAEPWTSVSTDANSMDPKLVLAFADGMTLKIDAYVMRSPAGFTWIKVLGGEELKIVQARVAIAFAKRRIRAYLQLNGRARFFNTTFSAAGSKAAEEDLRSCISEKRLSQ